MQLVLQPDDTTVCAASSVAMIAGVDLNEAVRVCGITTLAGGTLVREIRRGLNALGVRIGKTKTGYWYRGKKMHRTRDIPPFCLAVINRVKDDFCHAVVIKDGFVYDPGINYPLPLQVYEELVLCCVYGFARKRKNGLIRRVGARWASFIPVLEVPNRSKPDGTSQGQPQSNDNGTGTGS
jgi:hypothetical protein